MRKVGTFFLFLAVLVAVYFAATMYVSQYRTLQEAGIIWQGSKAK